MIVAGQRLIYSEGQGTRRRLTLLTSSISRAAGGVFDAVRNLAIAVKRENRYSLFVIGLRDEATDQDLSVWGGINTEAFKVLGPRAFGYAPGLADAVESSTPDILHVHGLWMYPSVAAHRWSRRCRPYVESPHGMLDSWALNNSQLKKRISAALYENRNLRAAACLHALNRAEAEMIRAYGLKNPICVIPNGVELPMESDIKPARENHTLLYLGRLHPKKGLSKLIEAWARVKKEAEEAVWRLVIAGWEQNGHRRELEMLTARLHANSSISFLGPQFGTDKATCYKEASAFILPSLSEGLPMTILEAWSWWLPVLITSQCNLPEGGASGAAIMMEPDVDSISAALRRLFSMSDAERKGMGLNGRLLVEQHFQWSRVGRQMSDVYDWVLGLGSKPDYILD
jgi:glycosyltransferase involved in cell wall biosynthesis